MYNVEVVPDMKLLQNLHNPNALQSGIQLNQHYFSARIICITQIQLHKPTILYNLNTKPVSQGSFRWLITDLASAGSFADGVS